MPATEPAPPNDLPRHPVRVVAQRSGLSTHVLRAWERRHQVVSPARSDGGPRLYSDADIERLTLLRQLTSHGGAIGQLAQLPREELARLARADQAERVGEGAAEGEGEAARWRESALRAIEALDGVSLRRQLERGVVALGVHPFLDRVVTPVLIEVGQRWRSGAMGIAHEHLATAVFRQVAAVTRGRFVFIEYGGDVVGTAESHGIAGAIQMTGNNLDQILDDSLVDEIEGWRRPL